MRNYVKYTIPIFVLLFIQSGVFALECINEATLPLSPVVYSSGAIYQFNITCNDTVGSVNAWLTFDGTNYDMSNEGNEFYVSLTDLAVGSYLYNFTCNDTTGNITSNTWSYIINQNTSTQNFMNLTIGTGTTGVEDNQIYVLNTNTNTTGWYSTDVFNGQDITFTLYRDDTEIGISNPISDTGTYDIGTYLYTYNTSGNQNYSAAFKQFTLEITKIPTSIKLWLNGTEWGKSYNINDIANFTALINVTGLTVNLTSDYHGWEETSDVTKVTNLTNLTEEGLFYIKAFFNGNENYSESSKTYYFDTIGPKYSNIIEPDNVYDRNKIYQFKITWSDAKTDQVWFESNHTGSLQNYTYSDVYNESGVFMINLTDLAVGNYVYRWIARDDLVNYNSTVDLDFTVEKKPVLTITAAYSQYNRNSPSNSNVTCWSNDSYITNNNFSFTCPTCGTYSIPLVGVDTRGLSFYGYYLNDIYIFTCTLKNDLSQNYTGDSGLTLSIVDVTPADTTTTGTTGSGGSVVTGTYYIQNLNPLTVKAGESGSEAFIIKNNYSTTMRNLNLSLSGIPYDKGWCSLDKTIISRIDKGAAASVKITCDISEDADVRAYTLTVRAQLYQTVKQQTMTLTVASATPPEEEVVEEEVVTSTLELNETANVTTPTGFILAPELIPNIILVAAFIACLLILIFRNKITETLFDIHRGYKIDSITEKVEKKPKPKPGKSFRDTYNKYSFKLNIELKKPEKEKERVNLNK